MRWRLYQTVLRVNSSTGRFFFFFIGSSASPGASAGGRSSRSHPGGTRRSEAPRWSCAAPPPPPARRPRRHPAQPHGRLGHRGPKPEGEELDRVIRHGEGEQLVVLPVEHLEA